MPGVFNFVQCHGKLAATNRRLNVMSVLLLTGQVNVHIVLQKCTSAWHLLWNNINTLMIAHGQS